MDANIIAFVRDNAKTVTVKCFPYSFATTKTLVQAWEEEHRTNTLGELGVKSHMYVTTLDLKVGDLCVVYVNQYPIVVEVQEVHNDVQIEPNLAQEIKWIVAKLDTEYYDRLSAENKLIKETLLKEYRRSTQRQFRDLVINSLTEEGRKTIGEIVGSTKS